MASNLLRYSRAFHCSQEILFHAGIDRFPIDIMSVIKNVNPEIIVSSLSEYMSKRHLLPKPLQIDLDIKDARCYYAPNYDVKLIIYNDAQPYRRIRFSLAHELAHIVMGHLNDERTELSRGGLPDPIYYAMEGEANVFSGNFLAPPILVHEYAKEKITDAWSIANLFELSLEAVRDYRIPDYDLWLRTEPQKNEKNILARCIPRLHPHTCGKCGGTHYGKSIQYCIYCGKKYRLDNVPLDWDSVISDSSLEWRDNVQYREFPTDDEGRLRECLECENEVFADSGIYCHICGKPIKNTCCHDYDHDGVAYSCAKAMQNGIPSNARYCPYCGEPTAFYRADVLQSWEEEKKKIEDDDLPW